MVLSVLFKVCHLFYKVAIYLQLSYISVKSRIQDVIRKLESDRILSDLCLLTVQLFIKFGKLNEARNAIVEAEHAVWTNNPMVRCVGTVLISI